MTALAEVVELVGADVAGKLRFDADEANRETVLEVAPVLRSALGDDNRRATILTAPPFELPPEYPPALTLDSKDTADVAEKIEEFKANHGQKPSVVSVKDIALFAGGGDIDTARRELAAACVAASGVDEDVVPLETACAPGRLTGKIALVTGGARGFGLGIAEELAANGATVVLADLDVDGAAAAAETLSKKAGRTAAFALKVDISDEDSVRSMFEKIVLAVGGLDLLVANAGVLKAGPVVDFDKKDWDFVTKINYSGYFLCVKHAAAVMARQNAAGGPWTDIVQVNSKSGLVGSKRNAAYAGSKFGTIGLTQSFALELIEHQIKVNSVCPGNFFDGPLWSNPENGLFVQYLRSGKVPGAKNVEDVKKYYENMIPMGRGCFPADVAKAIMYCVEQAYETGQAIPVTGGQVMLN